MGRFRVNRLYYHFFTFFLFKQFHFRNYYATGSSALNWRENQFHIVLSPGPTVGSPVTLEGFENLPPSITFTNELVTGSAGTGDLADVYLAPDGTHGYLRGSLS